MKERSFSPTICLGVALGAVVMALQPAAASDLESQFSRDINLSAHSSFVSQLFKTDAASATPQIDYMPRNPLVGQVVTFIDETVFESGIHDPVRWVWSLGSTSCCYQCSNEHCSGGSAYEICNDDPPTGPECTFDANQNVLHAFTNPGSHTIGLDVCFLGPLGTPKCTGPVMETLNVLDKFRLIVARPGTGSGRITSDPIGIDCGNDCAEEYLVNTVVSLTARPDACSVFSRWSGDPSCDAQIVMDGDKTCLAHFNKLQKSLIVSKEGSGHGHVLSSPPGIDCGIDCTQEYDCGATISLVASPEPDSIFTGWAGDCAGSEESISIDLDADKTCTAIFTESLDLGRRSALVVPGFEVEIEDPEGPTTFFAVRNSADEDIQVEVAYHGERFMGEPLRTDTFFVGPQETLAQNVRNDLDDLNENDGLATGLIVISETDRDASGLEGDYFRLDSRNDFATGDRLFRTGDFCAQQEIRAVDFGSGSRLQILLAQPQGEEVSSFSYEVVNQGGAAIAAGSFSTSEHLVAIDVEDLVSDLRFGSLIFDFSDAGGGFVTAIYSAFGRFSVEFNGACRESVQDLTHQLTSSKQYEALQAPVQGPVQAQSSADLPSLNMEPKVCTIHALTCNSADTEDLATDSCSLGNDAFFDGWQFVGAAGSTVTLDMPSDDFDTLSFLLDPASIIAIDDAYLEGTDSRVVVTLGSTETQLIPGHHFPEARGEYTLTLACDDESSTDSQLLVPGFRFETANPEGPNTLFAVRNTTDVAIDVDIAYFEERLDDEPLLTSVVRLEPRATTARSVRNDLSSLDISDAFATGLIVINESEGDASNLEGDYFQIDSANDFATGDRLVRSGEFCTQQEIRFVDFGSGSQFRILVMNPQGSENPTFSYKAFSQGGEILIERDFVTSQHLTTIDVGALVPGHTFGTVVFDFSRSEGGFVTARYSAFGRFSVELNGACTVK